MSILNNKNTAFILTVLGLVFVMIFLLISKVFTDNSVMSYSVFLTWSLLFSILPSIIFVLFDLKHSLFMSCVSSALLATIAIFLIYNRNTVDFYSVDELQAKSFISNTGENDFKDIINFSGEWIKNQSITVIFHGEEKVSYEKGDKATIDSSKFIKSKEAFINKVHHLNNSRKDDSKALIVTENFNLLDIKNQYDEKLLVDMLNEIYYTKFSKNIIILIKLYNFLKLRENGFSRSITDSSKKKNQNTPTKTEEPESSEETENEPSTPKGELETKENSASVINPNDSNNTEVLISIPDNNLNPNDNTYQKDNNSSNDNVEDKKKNDKSNDLITNSKINVSSDVINAKSKDTKKSDSRKNSSASSDDSNSSFDVINDTEVKTESDKNLLDTSAGVFTDKNEPSSSANVSTDKNAVFISKEKKDAANKKSMNAEKN